MRKPTLFTNSPGEEAWTGLKKLFCSSQKSKFNVSERLCHVHAPRYHGRVVCDIVLHDVPGEAGGCGDFGGGSKAHTSTRLWFGRRLPQCSPEDDELRNEHGSGSIVVTVYGSGGVLLLISNLEHCPCALQWHLAASSDAPLLTHIGLAGTTSLVRRSTCD